MGSGKDESALRDPRYWSKELESGDPIIDWQHKELLRRFVSLEDALKEGSGQELIVEIVAFLQRYVLTHFNAEEQIMLAHKYPQYSEHAEQHEVYKKRIFQFKQFVHQDFRDPKILDVSYSLLRNWIAEHISVHDKAFIRFTKGTEKSTPQIDIEHDWTPENSQLWTPDFAVGDEAIDQQHMELVKWTEVITRSQDIPHEQLLNILDFLQRFIVNHFTDEEVFMIDMDFVDVEHHTHLHRQYRKQCIQLKEDCREQIEEGELHSRVQELCESYFEHIGQDDLQYRRLYKAK